MASLYPRLLQVLPSRQVHVHYNVITMATRLPQVMASLQDGCLLYNTQILNSSSCNRYCNASRTVFCQLSRNVQTKTVMPIPCLRNLRRLVPVEIAVTSSILPASAVETCRQFHTQAPLMAGHNKWSNIKHIKGAKDQARSLIFAKYTKLIRIAVKENGPNPALNTQLANVIQMAASKDMPKANIENAIKTANKAVPEVSQIYELKGPGGCALLVDVLTENPNKTRQEMAKLLKNSGASVGDAGSIMYAFQRKGVVKVKPESSSDQQPLTLDLATEVAIEVEAEDVQETVNEDNERVFMFICDLSDVSTVKKGLSSLSYTVESSGLEYVPVQDYLIELNSANLEKVSQIIQMLEDRPDVLKVYDNITVAE